MTPPFEQIDVQAADVQKTFSISLTNNTKSTQTLRLSVVDFGSLADTGGLVFIGEANDFEKKYGLANWLTLEKNQITLEPGETQTLKVTVDNRQSLSAGGHYGAVLFKSLGETVVKGTPVNFDQVLANLVFVRKIGGEHYGLEINRSDTSFDALGIPRQIKLRFQNTGNVHLVPRGFITVTDPVGHEIARGVLNLSSSLILPEAFRIYTTDMRKERGVWWPGTYKMKIQYRYDGRDEYTTAESTFKVSPAGGIAVGSLGILALAVLIVLGPKLLRRRKK